MGGSILGTLLVVGCWLLVVGCWWWVWWWVWWCGDLQTDGFVTIFLFFVLVLCIFRPLLKESTGISRSRRQNEDADSVQGSTEMQHLQQCFQRCVLYDECRQKPFVFLGRTNQSTIPHYHHHHQQQQQHHHHHHHQQQQHHYQQQQQQQQQQHQQQQQPHKTAKKRRKTEGCGHNIIANDNTTTQ